MLKETIEAVTICIGYGDFLKETAKYNAPIFDKWLIVTTPDDEVTREVCRQYSLPVLMSEDGKSDAGDGGQFCKGRLIDRGLCHMSANGWRIHIDADIVLPTRTRHFLEVAELNKKKLYGIDRIMIESYDKWKELEHSGWLQRDHHDYHCRVRTYGDNKIGTRWADMNMGYCPPGFFQCFHSGQDQYRGIRSRTYPHTHSDACRTDIQFAMLWDRKDRELIPEIIAVHLESQKSPKGLNWKGRKSIPFGPVTSNPPQITSCS